MPELHFKGKEFVFNHHLGVPYRPLQPDAAKSVGGTALDGNLIIQGDNLHALKALMPLYAGKVDCIFIDPPYNTGNEKWSYNDNVNSPILRDWLTTNPVDKEDMLRHDKWLCLMYPRFKLLHSLLSEHGSFWMTLDDNEVHRARAVLDEIFGEQNFVATCIWQKKYSTKADTQFLSESHDYIVIYAKDISQLELNGLERTEEQDANYKNLDNDPRGDWASDNLLRTEARDYAIYEVIGPTGIKHLPPKGASWRFNKDKMEALISDNRVWFGEDGNNKPRLKRFRSEVRETVPAQTIWGFSEVGHSDSAKKALAGIFSDHDEIFATPKPVPLIRRVVELATDRFGLVLDSFAGSGTTGHAVLEANKQDGGKRRFIMVECEEYADTLTAERMRRVVQGYSFEGTTKEELLSTKISFTSLKKADKLLEQVQGIENLEGHRFDKITKKIENDTLTVVGEKKVTEKVEGLGGSFTFCTLGEPLDLDKLLTGEALPDYLSLGSWLFHTATMAALEPAKINEAEWYLGESSQYHVWLVYRPELEFLKSRDAALTLNLAQKIAAAKTGKKHLVFAAAKFVPNKDLLPIGVEFSPLPFALYRVEK